MSFQPSTLFQSWASQLRIKWMSFKGRAHVMAYAAVLGDWTTDWMTAALLERMPLTASPTALALIASERQADTYPGEPAATLAPRLTQWMLLWRYAGTPLGLLLGLHFSGFDGALLIQQNGVVWQLKLPLPTIVPGQPWDPSPNLVTSTCPQLALALTSSVTPSRSIPAGMPWFFFDSNTDFCSRFAVLFTSPLPSQFMTSGVAVFTGVEDGSVLHPWPTVTWSNAFADLTYRVQPGAVTITDGSGPVSVAADTASKTPTSVRIMASASFAGSVDVLAYQTGANPFADLHPSDLSRLRSVIVKWKPAKATCVNVTALIAGRMWDYPFGLTWDGTSLLWDQPSSSVQILGAF